MEFDIGTSDKEWVKARVDAVLSRYSAYDALVENGITLLDEDTSLQILCPFHGDKNKPSARYYSGSGRDHSHFYCFKCKMNLNGISLYSKFQNIEWRSALEKLERRFSIKIPRKSSDRSIQVRDSYGDKRSDKWGDINKLLNMVEGKLKRQRDRMIMVDFVKACRMVDAIIFDYDKSGQTTPDMITGLNNLMKFIDKSAVINVSLD